MIACVGGFEDEGVVEESRGIEKDGLRFQEELRKQGQVLAVELEKSY